MMIEAELKHWARSCLSKRYYATQAQAGKAARHRHSNGGPKLRSYFCSYCGGHHLTKQPLQPAAVPA